RSTTLTVAAVHLSSHNGNTRRSSIQAHIDALLIHERFPMPRPVTLSTGQWADLPLEQMARKTKQFGYDGIELACWGDHFDVQKADDAYCRRKRDLLTTHELQCHAISAHLVGQAVCDKIDERHKAILPPYVWGDGKPDAVN